jgi:transcription termination factor Rho
MPANGPDPRSRNRRPRRRPAGRAPMAEYDDFQDGDNRDLDINELRGMTSTSSRPSGSELEMEAGAPARKSSSTRFWSARVSWPVTPTPPASSTSSTKGFGFMRRHGLMPTPDDVYVSSSQIRRFGLRIGDRVSGSVRAPREGEKYWGMIRVDRSTASIPRRPSAGPSSGT